MSWPRRRAVLGAAAVVVATLALAALGLAFPGDEEELGRLQSDPSQDQIVPTGVALDVRTFGARGDGRTDDTDALQAAISAGIGTAIGEAGNPRRVLYLPSGTYLVTRPLEWRTSTGAWATGLTLLGQNRDRTTIRLADRTPGFDDASKPLPVVRTASRSADLPDGSGNQAFGNFIFDLTVEVGFGNPGADGLDYLANNRGAVRNVLLRAAPGSGHSGVSMTRRWPGPCLFEFVRIEGFDRGFDIGRSEYSVTFDDIELEGQRRAGIDNAGNVVTIRGLTTRSIGGPAVRNLGGPVSGLLTLVDSDLTGSMESAAFPSIDNDGAAYLLRVRTEGYSAAIRDRGRIVNLPADAEWSSTDGQPPRSPPEPAAQEPPAFPPGSSAGLNDWIGADEFGAVPDDRTDDTVGIQKALDSGRPVIYFRPGTYLVTAPLTVPPTVDEIAGFDASVNGTGGELGRGSAASIFVVREGSAVPLLISELVFVASPGVTDVERPGSRPIHLRDIHHGGIPFRGGPGEIFLTDVEGGRGWTFTPGQQVWARQLNPEQRITTKIRNSGARLWILGLKTETAGTVIESDSGASTEVLGGLLYPAEPVPSDQAAFAAHGASQSLTFATSAIDPTRTYQTLVRTDQRSVLRLSDVPARGKGSVVPLFRSD